MCTIPTSFPLNPPSPTITEWTAGDVHPKGPLAKFAKPRSALLAQAAKRRYIHPRQSGLKKELLASQELLVERFKARVAQDAKDRAARQAAAAASGLGAALILPATIFSTPILGCTTLTCSTIALPTLTPGTGASQSAGSSPQRVVPRQTRITWAYTRQIPSADVKILQGLTAAKVIGTRPRVSTPWSFLLVKKKVEHFGLKKELPAAARPIDSLEPFEVVGTPDRIDSAPLPDHPEFVGPAEMQAIKAPFERKRKLTKRPPWDYLCMHQLALKELRKEKDRTKRLLLGTGKVILKDLDLPWSMEAMALDIDKDVEMLDVEHEPQEEEPANPLLDAFYIQPSDLDRLLPTSSAVAQGKFLTTSPGPQMAALDLDLGSLETAPIDVQSEALELDALSSSFDDWIQPQEYTPFSNTMPWTHSLLLSIPLDYPPILHESLSILNTSLIPKGDSNTFNTVMAAPMSFFSATSAGKIISCFSQDTFIINFEFPLAMHDFGYEATCMVGSAILMIVSVPYLAIVVAFTLVLVYVIQKFYLAISQQLRRLDLSSKGPLYTLFAETVELNGLLTIRASRKDVPYTAANSALLARSQVPFYLTNVARLWLATTIGVITAVINTCFVLIAVGTCESTSAGLFAVGLSQAVSLQDIISLVLTSWTQLEITAVAIEWNLEYTRLTPKEDDVALGGKSKPETPWPSHGAIEFENVVASYDGQTEPSLKGITWSIVGATKVRLCGRTGSGKRDAVRWRRFALIHDFFDSTMLLAILCALHVQGKITIDNQDTAYIPRCTLRPNITVVPQDPLIIDGTLRENIDLSGKRMVVEIWTAIEAAQDCTHADLKTVVGGFEHKLDQPLTAWGNKLSKGQTQLLALARALLCRNRIVLLDKATGNLDVETDRAVQVTICTVFAECTIITVAHRIRTIADCDQVAVLDAGWIIEVGDPVRLLKDEGSAFARLARDSTM